MTEPIKQTQREIDEIFASDTLSYSRIESHTASWKVVTSTLSRTDGSVSQFQKIIKRG